MYWRFWLSPSQLLPSYAQKGAPTRLLTGKVLDHSDNALPNAVVYLTNTRNRAVKTYIVGPDGAFRFPALAPNVDYEVYAQFQGRKERQQDRSANLIIANKCRSTLTVDA